MVKMVTLTVDKSEIAAEEGSNLLEVCLENGIYIPNLCYLPEMPHPQASCRLCFVEIEGRSNPVAACTVKVTEGLVVRTDTPTVRRLQRSAFRFLLSMHRVDCSKCPANKNCELQRVARLLGVGLKPGPLERIQRELDVETDHPLFLYLPDRCVLCGKCVYVCEKKHGQPVLTFARRGIEMVVSFYGAEDLSALPCKDCLSCIEVCPVAAILLKT